MNTNTLIFVDRINFGHHLALHMAIRHDDDSVSVFQPVTLQRIPKEDIDDSPRIPFLTLKDGAAQKLADELWNAGIRPTQSRQGAGQAEATGKHLNDMRAIVAHMVKVELPK